MALSARARISRLPTSMSRRRVGIALAAVTAVVSGLAVWINGYGVRAWTGAGASSATYTTAKNLVAALLLGVIALAATRRRSLEGLTRPAGTRQWAGLVAVGVVGGSVPFLLFFEGLSRASSSQAAFIHKTLVVWVALLAVPFLRERLSAFHLAAIGLLIGGQLALVGGAGDIRPGAAEAMILAATLLWAVEVVMAKKLLGSLSALTVANARMGFGVVALAGYLVVTGGVAELGGLALHHLGWAVITGAVLTTYVASWYLALARAQAVDVTAVLVFGAVITAVLRTGVNGAALPSPLGLGLVTAGALVAVIAARRRVPEQP